MCIDSGCPAKQLIYQFLYLKFLPTEDLKAWGAFGKLAQQVSFCASFGRRWNNDFSLFLPVFQDFSFIYRLLVPLNQSLSLTYMHVLTCMLSHTHTHTHLSFPNVPFYLIALCHDLKTFHFGAYTFIRGQGFSICCHQKIAKSFTASPKPSPRDRRKVLGAEPSEKTSWALRN